MLGKMIPSKTDTYTAFNLKARTIHRFNNLKILTFTSTTPFESLKPLTINNKNKTQPNVRQKYPLFLFVRHKTAKRKTLPCQSALQFALCSVSSRQQNENLPT